MIKRAPLFVGCLLRFFLLLISKEKNGFYGGDAFRYIDQAQKILNGHLPFEGTYPLGYPLFLSPFLSFTGSAFFASFFCVILFGFFLGWFNSKIEVIAGAKQAWWGSWFLALNPVWFSFTVVVGADFLGSIIFGFVFLALIETLSRPADLKKFSLLGLGFFVAAVVKPVYLYVPILVAPLFFRAQKFQIRSFFGMIVAFSIFTGSYVVIRHNQVGSYSFSGHNISLFGSYIVGSSLVAEGRATNLYQGLALATHNLNESQLANPNYQWKDYILDTVKANPIIFGKLALASVVKNLFGNSNVQIVRFFTGHDVEGPGLWAAFAKSSPTTSSIKSFGLLWFMGAALCGVLKLALLFFAFKGAMVFWKTQKRIELFTLTLLLCYFLFTPIVFGEPRYFLPGDLILLHLAACNSVDITSRMKFANSS